MKKATRSEKQGSQSQSQHNTAATLIASVLRHLLHIGSLNKYEAASHLGDWSLSSTISDLAIRYGVTITRTMVTVGRSRQPVARYSIDGQARGHAFDVLTLLDGKARKGGA